MLSEDFDNKIREAAEHHHPAYDEKAWEKMEKLLDKHLPQEEKRRKRRIFIWWFMFLAGAGIALWLGGVLPTGHKDRVAEQASLGPVTPQKLNTSTPRNATEKVRKDTDGASLSDIPATPESMMGSKPSGAGQEKEPSRLTDPVPAATISGTSHLTEPAHLKPSATDKQPAGRLTLSGPVARAERPITRKRKTERVKQQTAGFLKETAPAIVSNDKSPQAILMEPGPVPEKAGLLTPETKHAGPPASIPVAASPAGVRPDLPDSVISAGMPNTFKTDSTAMAIKSTATQKKRGSTGGFLITVSAGPDLAFVGGAAPGQVRLNRGIGVGYTFRNRLTIRTGYFSSRKVYDAPAEAYDPPAVFWNYYPYLDNVKGNCIIHEIPFLLSYRFAGPGRGQWMATAGISSYLMKKEEYYYTYKTTQNGPSLYREWTNKKPGDFPFSVLTLSAGYEYRLNKRMQLLAEPYFKLPLAGVGYGKVKLKSTGVLLTLGWRPFGR